MPARTAKVDAEIRILAALHNPEYRWRTATGIADESGVDLESVQRFLSANKDRIVATEDAKGRRLFATKDDYQKRSSGWNKFLSGASGRLK